MIIFTINCWSQGLTGTWEYFSSNQIPSCHLVYKLRWFAALHKSEIFLWPFSESETLAMIIVYFSRHTETYYTLWYGVVTPIGRLVLLLLLLWLQWYFQPLRITNIGRLVLLLVVSFFPETINTGRHIFVVVSYNITLPDFVLAKVVVKNDWKYCVTNTH